MAFAKEVSDFLNAFKTTSDVLGTPASREGERLDNEYRRAATEHMRWDMNKEERDRQELLDFGMGSPSIYDDGLSGGGGGDGMGGGGGADLTHGGLTSGDWARSLSPRLTGGAASRSDSLTGLNSDFGSRLSAMFADAPPGLGIKSAYRSPQTQQVLWDRALKKYGDPEVADNWVARPGQSNHGRGIAVDLAFGNDATKAWVHQNAAKYGLRFPMSWEPWHIEPIGGRGGSSGGGGRNTMAGGRGGDTLSGGGVPGFDQIVAYIQQAAAKRNIDPGVALKVAEAEGLQPGTWQSKIHGKQGRETSYGPYQLFVGGGLGDEFAQKYGDPSDPGTVFQQVDFALDHAAQNGWGAFHGAANTGIGEFDGLDGAKAIGVMRGGPGTDVLGSEDRAGSAAPAIPETAQGQPTAELDAEIERRIQYYEDHILGHPVQGKRREQVKMLVIDQMRKEGKTYAGTPSSVGSMDAGISAPADTRAAPDYSAGFNAPSALPERDNTAVPFNVTPPVPPAPPGPDTSAIPYNVDPNDPLGTNDPDYQAYKQTKYGSLHPQYPGVLGKGGTTEEDTVNVEPVSSDVMPDPRLRPDTAEPDAKPRAIPETAAPRHKPGFDPLPQTSGHMDRVSQSGHESLNPAAQQFIQQADAVPRKHILRGVLNFAQEAFGFNAQGIDASADGESPAKDAFLSGHGAANAHLVDQIEDKIDPEHKMTEEARHIAAMNRMWHFYMLKGDPAKAHAATLALYQSYKAMAQKWGAIAQASAQDGNVDAAVDAYVNAYSMVPDGNTMHAEKNADGSYAVTITNEKGETTTSSVLTPDQVMEHIMNIGPGDFDSLILHDLTGEETTPKDTGAADFTGTALEGLGGTGSTGEVAPPAPAPGAVASPGGLAGSGGPDTLTEGAIPEGDTEGGYGTSAVATAALPNEMTGEGTLPSPDDISGSSAIPETVTPEVTSPSAGPVRNIPPAEAPPPLTEYMAPLLKWRGPNGQGPTAEQLSNAVTLWNAKQKAFIDYQKTLPTAADNAELQAQSDFFDAIGKIPREMRWEGPITELGIGGPFDLMDQVGYKVRPSLEAALKAHNDIADQLVKEASGAAAGEIITLANQPPPRGMNAGEDLLRRQENQQVASPMSGEGLLTSEQLMTGATDNTDIMGTAAVSQEEVGIPINVGQLLPSDQTNVNTAIEQANTRIGARNKELDVALPVPKTPEGGYDEGYVDPIAGAVTYGPSGEAIVQTPGMIDNIFYELEHRVGGTTDLATIDPKQAANVAGILAIKKGIDAFGLRPTISSAAQMIAALPQNGMTTEQGVAASLRVLAVDPINPENRLIEAEWVDDSKTFVRVKSLTGERGEIIMPINTFLQLDDGRKQIAQYHKDKLAQDAAGAAQSAIDAEQSAIDTMTEQQRLENQPRQESQGPVPLPPAPDANLY